MVKLKDIHTESTMKCGCGMHILGLFISAYNYNDAILFSRSRIHRFISLYDVCATIDECIYIYMS